MTNDEIEIQIILLESEIDRLFSTPPPHVSLQASRNQARSHQEPWYCHV